MNADAATESGLADATPKPILYVDLDNTLVNFQSGIDRLPSKALIEYEGRYDEAPGIFALMEPMPEAVESFTELAKHYDAYILSTAPWANPSAWQHKLEWVQLHFGSGEHLPSGERNPAYKRLILSHHKNLNNGAFLVDDRGANGADRFDGEWVPFGSEKFPDWARVRAYLLEARATDLTGLASTGSPAPA